MTIAGVIAEFNPFHLGHQYLFETIKQKLQPEYLIVCMSGNFVQRGEPAVVDKWIRTKMALLGGADLVLELPTEYATNSAELFASASIQILDRTGICDVLCFGSESNNLDFLSETANYLAQEPDNFKHDLTQALSKGLSFPAARNIALQRRFPNAPSIFQANDILAVEYIKALQKYHSRIEPFPVPRVGAGYHCTEKKNGFASATAIRRAISQNDLLFCQETMPAESFALLLETLKHQMGPVSIEQYFQTIQYLLRIRSSKELAEIADISEGLEQRLKSSAMNASSVAELIANAKTKRYTYTRLSRCLIHLLLEIKKKESTQISIPYLRVLGFRRSSQVLLRKLEENCALPILTNPAKAKPIFQKNELFSKESIATDLYMMCLPSISYRKTGQEYTRPIVIV